jgi:hypothetical protein
MGVKENQVKEAEKEKRETLHIILLSFMLLVSQTRKYERTPSIRMEGMFSFTSVRP